MSPELLEQIEEKRGLVPRATYIEHCLKQYFTFQDSTNEFFDEILSTLPEKADREDCEKLRPIVENVRSKILDRKRLISPK